MNTRSLLLVAGSFVLASVLAVGSAAAQPASGPKPASFTKTCEQVEALGFTVTGNHIYIHNSGAPNPRAGSYSLGAGPSNTYHVSPLRAYGVVGPDRWFQDSFPLEPVAGKRTCGVKVTIKGKSGNVVNNDHIALIVPNAPGKLFTLGGGWANGYRFWTQPLTNNMGSWSYDTPTMKKDNSNPALSNALLSAVAGPGKFDVIVQDDSTVKSIKVTYRLY